MPVRGTNALTEAIAVIDRQFKGDIASTMDKLTTRALQAQVEAAVRHIYPSFCDTYTDYFL